MILLIYIFRWHNIKDEEICDPMEKILSLKGVIFMKIWISEFSGIFRNLFRFFWNLFQNILIKKGKNLMWDPRRGDMVCKAMWQRHANPHECLHGVDVVRTRGRATGVHTDAWVAPTWQDSLRAGRWRDETTRSSISHGLMLKIILNLPIWWN